MMDRAAVERFSIESRKKLIRSIDNAMVELGVSPKSEVESIESAGDVTIITLKGGFKTTITAEETKWRGELVEAIKAEGYDNILEKVAYTWFNRIIAVRYMEVNDYLPSHVRVLSSVIEGRKEPDIITQCLKMDLSMTQAENELVIRLKDSGEDDKLFSRLFIIQCRKLNEILPELFTKTKPYENLLLRISYIDPDGVVRDLVDNIPEDDFRDAVQIIGWMYQFYNTDLNNLVYDGSLSKSKLSKELVPAATTIYTPDWVVKYMVDNSLGRMWHEEGYCEIPYESTHYLKHIDQLSKLRNDRGPVEFKIIDPCMGSGHILLYTFDLLMEMYRSSGYSDSDSAEMIIQNNVYGADVNERAYQLAYFSLMMKARHYDIHFLEKGVTPNLAAIIETGDVNEEFINDIQNSLDPEDASILNNLRKRFMDSREYGSLLKGVNIKGLMDAIISVSPRVTMDYNYRNEMSMLKRLIKCSDILSDEYDVVVTNPPYLGSSRFSEKLSTYAKDVHPISKSDLSMMMYESSLNNLSKDGGYVAYITTNSWMFLSSFEKLRSTVLEEYQLVDVLDLGSELFDGKVGHNLIVSWITKNQKTDYPFTATKLDVFCYSQKDRKEPEFFNPENEYKMSPLSLKNIPGSPIAYWLSESIVHAFKEGVQLGFLAELKSGLSTGDNSRFIREWFEVAYDNISFVCDSRKDTYEKKWYPITKGGNYRKWYGNHSSVVNWLNDGYEIRHFVDEKGKTRSRPQNMDYYFMDGLTWCKLSSGQTSFRMKPRTIMFGGAGGGLFIDDYVNYIHGFCNSNVAMVIANAISPTLNYEVGHIASFPIIIDKNIVDGVDTLVKANVKITREEWDDYETSWDFSMNPLIRISKDFTIEESYNVYYQCCIEKFNSLRINEERINALFIEAYGLGDELQPSVCDENISIRVPEKNMCIIELISYAVGCMFGRYSLDCPGIQFAGGEFKPLEQRFMPDPDNIIPINDNEYFSDDIVSRFVEFIRIAFGDEHLEENLKFIANNLAVKGKGTSREIIRKYFLNDFYKDHLKMYSNLPIYWLFDSGKENGFKALIYMHRYDENLIAKMRQDYLLPMYRRYNEMFESEKDPVERSKLEKKINELSTYDLAMELYSTEKISIDLDDGVKVNYAKFQNIDNPGGKGKINLLYKLK